MRPADASYRVVDGQIVPDWLGPTDHPWLRDLLDRVAASVGEPASALEARLGQPLARFAPPGRLRMVRAVLRDLAGTAEVPTSPAPRAVRDAVFAASTALRRAGGWTREAALDAAAEALGVDRDTVEAHLLADLPAARPVTLEDPLPDPSALALRVNTALAASLLHRAREVRLRLYGSARDLVRSGSAACCSWPGGSRTASS